jgi:hypothetical protein
MTPYPSEYPVLLFTYRLTDPFLEQKDVLQLRNNLL